MKEICMNSTNISFFSLPGRSNIEIRQYTPMEHLMMKEKVKTSKHLTKEEKAILKEYRASAKKSKKK